MAPMGGGLTSLINKCPDNMSYHDWTNLISSINTTTQHYNTPNNNVDIVKCKYCIESVKTFQQLHATIESLNQRLNFIMEHIQIE